MATTNASLKNVNLPDYSVYLQFGISVIHRVYDPLIPFVTYECLISP
jgi:hypothetical protein